MKIRSQRLARYIAISFQSVFAVLVGLCFSARAWDDHNQTQINCDIQNTACTQSLSDLTVTLDIRPKPIKAMTDLTFTVTLSGEKKLPSDPFIDLGMPGMKMGPNQVKLIAKGSSTYEGTGIIVRCPSGRRTWRAAVIIPGKGSAEFVFDVIY
jgi:hypothetical protein